MPKKPLVLVVDDEPHIREALRQGLSYDGFDIHAAPSAQQALEFLDLIGADAVVSDLQMPDMSGLALTETVSERYPNLPVIILTGHGGIPEATQAMRFGAYDFLTKPIDLEHLSLVLQRALKLSQLTQNAESMQSRLQSLKHLDRFVGQSDAIQRVLAMVQQVSPTQATVLLTGESGTGKEIIASLIHENSPRHTGPFIRVHCSALPENLLESEFFGHEKGAFTGASQLRRGRFELADGGTIFLDEIGEISSNVQVKLLRVLQERQFERVGGEKTLTSDIRLIAATNRDLYQEVQEGRFREDLYYRLNVVHLRLPPLRERLGDIPLLAQTLLMDAAKKHHKPCPKIPPSLLQQLQKYPWPGNIRQLQNTMETLLVLSPEKQLDAQYLPQEITASQATDTMIRIPVGSSMELIKQQAIEDTLRYFHGNKAQTARALGIGYKTLLRMLSS